MALNEMLAKLGNLSEDELALVYEATNYIREELSRLNTVLEIYPSKDSEHIFAGVVGSVLFLSAAGAPAGMNEHHFTNLIAAFARHCHDEMAAGRASPLKLAGTN